MRGACNRDLHIVQVGSRAYERESLDRLRGAPEVGNQLWVSGGADHFALGYGDGVRQVPRLHDVAQRHLDEDRLHGAEPKRQPLDQWSAFAVCSGIIDRNPDYDLDDVLVVEEPEQLRAIADALRSRIITLLNERAASTTELAAVLDTPKGTVGHHLKVLEKAGLVRVVRTRKVRALTEKYYGRVARLFVLKAVETAPEELRGGVIASLMLRQAADEVIASGTVEKDESAFVHVRLTPADVLRFQRRLNRLVADFQSSEDPEGDMHALAFALFQATTVLPPRGGDA
jgi:DNA-binding transcriptional ArsR family regulator